MIKLKNITTAQKRLFVRGYPVIVEAGEIIEVDKAVYDKRSFQRYIEKKTSKSRKKSRKKRREIKTEEKIENGI